jgi:hypothetical protein
MALPQVLEGVVAVLVMCLVLAADSWQRAVITGTTTS